MSYYKKRNCEPRPCNICGTVFTPSHGNMRLCPDCREKFSKNRGRDFGTVRYEGPSNVIEYEQKLLRRNVENYRDTIVAIGYADRQRAATLRLVGRVNTEL